MNLTALLSWWDEPVEWLGATVQSLERAGVTQLLAVDGAYPGVRGGTAASPADQADLICDVAHACAIDVEIVTPGGLWASECAKRAFMFELAATLEPAPDWFLVIDADEVILTAPPDLHERLAGTERDCAEAASLEQPSAVHGAEVEGAEMPQMLAGRWVKPRRCLFRALPGLTVGGAHYDYVLPDGRNLWGDGDERALPVRDLVIDHRSQSRTPERAKARDEYYATRDALGLERGRTRWFAPANQDRVRAMLTQWGETMQQEAAE